MSYPCGLRTASKWDYPIKAALNELCQLRAHPLSGSGDKKGAYGAETMSPLGHGTGQSTPLPLHTFHTHQRPCIPRVLALECQGDCLFPHCHVSQEKLPS